MDSAVNVFTSTFELECVYIFILGILFELCILMDLIHILNLTFLILLKPF